MPSAKDLQYRFDKWFPRGVNLHFVHDTPEDPGNPQYFIPRVIVKEAPSTLTTVTDLEPSGFTIYLDPIGVGREWFFRIEDEPEDYGSKDGFTALIFTATEPCVETLYMTSHITDVMDVSLRQYEKTRAWFSEIS